MSDADHTVDLNHEEAGQEIDHLWDELITLIRSETMFSEQIALCQRILHLNNAAQHLSPSMQGHIFMMLGLALRNSAKQSDEEDIASILEEAISNYTLALKLFEDGDMRDTYGSAQMLKGTALSQLANLSSGAKAISLLEEALACYDVALTIYPWSEHSLQHAEIQRSRGLDLAKLATYYTGTKATLLLEQAIACYNIALEICSDESMAVQHAAMQELKGGVLEALAVQRSGVQAITLWDEAIACYDVALEVYTRYQKTADYMRALQEKGAVLIDLAMVCGALEDSTMLERAIAYYDAALNIYQEDNPSYRYATLLNNKGAVLQTLAEQSIETKRVELATQAVACYDMALALFDPSTRQYGDTQRNKGTALLIVTEQVGLERQEEIALLEQVISCYNVTLSIYDQHGIINDHLSVQVFVNKGLASQKLAEEVPDTSKKIFLLEQAVSCCDASLTILGQIRAEMGYAAEVEEGYVVTLTNKSNALRLLAEQYPREAKARDLLEQAIACCHETLTICERMDMPKRKADATMNLGIARKILAEHSARAEATRLLEQAIADYDTALQLFDVNIYEYAQAQENKGTALMALAKLYGKPKDSTLLKQAITCYDSAIEAHRRDKRKYHYAQVQSNKGAVLQLLAEQSTGAETLLLAGQAITCCDIALTIFDRNSTAFQYAIVQYNKGAALKTLAQQYKEREKTALLKQALSCNNVALEIYRSLNRTREEVLTLVHKGETLLLLEGIADLTDSPILTTDDTISSMSSLHLHRDPEQSFTPLESVQEDVRTEAIALLRQAVACFDEALRASDTQSEAAEGDTIYMNKGICLAGLAVRSEGAETKRLLHQAIACYDVALFICDAHKDRYRYAQIHESKGTTSTELATRSEGDEAKPLLLQAITCYDVALKVYDPMDSPSEYARAHSSKGVALVRLGELTEKTEGLMLLEQAIACFETALKFRDRSTAAPKHASTQIALGVALRTLAERQSGAEGVVLLERSIACYDVVIAINDQDMKMLSAMAQQNKSFALRSLAERRGGTEATNLLKQAVSCCDSSLAIFHSMGVLSYYAAAQLNKGAALESLADYSSGVEAIKYLRQTIACYDIALAIWNRNNMAPMYATVQMNKGNALHHLAWRRGGEEAMQLFEQALTCYDIALGIRQRATMPLQHATTQVNKGQTLTSLAYRLGARKSASDVLKAAIASYDIALAIYDRKFMAHEYADTQLNKANALRLLAWQAERSDVEQVRHLLDQALTCIGNALEDNDPTNMTLLDANAQRLKGLILVLLARLNKREEIPFLKNASACYTMAQDYYSQSSMFHEHRQAALALAQIHLTVASLLKEHAEFIEDLEKAEQAVEQALGSSRILERLAPSLEFRQAEWTENASVYMVAATVQALQGNLNGAVTLLEEGRARGLAELQNRRQMNLKMLTPEEREKYEAAVNAVMALEARSRKGGTFHQALTLADEARAAHMILTRVVEQILQAHPNFLPESHISASGLASSLRPAEVLVYLVPMDAGLLLVFVPWIGELQIEWVSELSEDQLRELAWWNGKQPGYLLADSGGEAASFIQALDKLLPLLGEKFMRRLVQKARGLGAHRAILIPCKLLAALPLHAATYLPLASDNAPTAPNGQRYACDDLAITYAPSGAVFLAARMAFQQAKTPQRGFVVGNPKLTPASDPRWELGKPGYLPYAEQEASSVVAIMRDAGLEVTYKQGAEATWRAVVDGLRDADIAHLAMHAVFDTSDPLSSALLVAPQAKLYLRDLLDAQLITMSQLRLAVLSACQSGLGDFWEHQDEAVGLFGALLAAGAMGVMGSLWPIYDYSTKLVMEAFSQRYLQRDQEPSIALRNAIRWLRGLPDEIPAEYNESSSSGTDLVGTQHPMAQQYDEKVATMSTMIRQQSSGSDDKSVSMAIDQLQVPLEHPIHWAAFVYYGS